MTVPRPQSLATALACCLLLSLGGCATSPKVNETWRADDLPAEPFDKVLVVGIARTARGRRMFENELAARIGETAVPSRDLIPNREDVGRETVLEAVERSGADAVLVTRMADIDTTATARGGMTQVDRVRKNERLVDVFRYDYVETEKIKQIEFSTDILVTTDLYRVSDQQRVYSMESAAFDQTNLEGLVDDLGGAIARQLRRNKLIR